MQVQTSEPLTALQHGPIVSDERYKTDIVDSSAGLNFITRCRPRTFRYKTLGELPETFRVYEADSTEVFKNSQTNHGFIAQEVKAAIDADDSIKDGFRLWDTRDDGSQEVAESALIPVLVKAIQEQQALIEIADGKNCRAGELKMAEESRTRTTEQKAQDYTAMGHSVELIDKIRG